MWAAASARLLSVINAHFEDVPLVVLGHALGVGFGVALVAEFHVQHRSLASCEGCAGVELVAEYVSRKVAGAVNAVPISRHINWGARGGGRGLRCQFPGAAAHLAVVENDGNGS